ncbi:MAG: hypothetical protein HRT66_10650 [Flavobacteriaceae bacterium]|nr:hypothetical protein [Flavobacteriaceae bacterium]
MISLFKRLWNSPTFTTWASLLVISLNTIIVLPMILIKFSSIETNIYFIFMTIGQIKNIFDFGLKGNISRLFSYSYAGVTDLDKLTTPEGSKKEPNYELLFNLFNRAKLYYKYIFIITLVLVSFIIWLSVDSKVYENKDYIYSAIAMVIGSCFFIYNNLYVSFITGINEVALIKRWEVLLKGLASISMIVVVTLYPSLLNIMLVLNIWIIINFISYSFIIKPFLKNKKSFVLDNKEVYTKLDKIIFGLSRRSFVIGLAGTGSKQIMNILIANFVAIDIANSYLFTERIFEQLKEVSRAPFYSKIPLFSKLRGQGDLKEMISKVRFSMSFSYWINIMGLATLFFFGDLVLSIINSKVLFINETTFIIMAVFLLLERYTSMHIQLYIFMTNKIVGQFRFILLGLSLALFTCLLYPLLGIVALPTASIISYMLFLTIYFSNKNYNEIKQSFYTFEKKTIIPIITILFIFIIIHEIYIPYT